LSFALPYYPGWRVQVDGQEKELLRAYGGLSAVYLPAGTHVVRLDYQSNGLLLGAILSGMGWLLTAALGIGLFVRARRMNHVSEQWA
jgi:uncharacterized membrane protein YfhO